MNVPSPDDAAHSLVDALSTPATLKRVRELYPPYRHMTDDELRAVLAVKAKARIVDRARRV